MASPVVTIELTEKELRLLSRAAEWKMEGTLRDKISDARKRLQPIKRAHNREKKQKRLERKAAYGEGQIREAGRSPEDH